MNYTNALEQNYFGQVSEPFRGKKLTSMGNDNDKCRLVH